MPLRSAFSLIASSKLRGSRIFRDADFFSISKCMGLNPDRSYFDKSAVSINCSAASSVLNDGMGFGLTVFIVVNFVPVHITSTDRSDPGLAFSHAHHVHDKDITASVRLAYCPHPRLIRTGIRQDSRCMAEEPFNFFLADPMFSAFWPISVIPIKSSYHFFYR